MSDHIGPPDPEMLFRYEIEFVGGLLVAATATAGRDSEKEEKDAAAWQAIESVDPEMITDPTVREIYDALRGRFVEGIAIDPTQILEDIGGLRDPEKLEIFGAVQEAGFWHVLQGRGEILIREHRRREFKVLLHKADEALGDKHGRDGGMKLAQRLSMKLMELWGSAQAGSARYHDAQSVVEELKRRATSEDRQGVAFPWPKLEKHAGPVIPGDDCLGISAYSNAGKSTVAANLFWLWVKRGIPCIAFPTEMALQWVERGVAALSDVSQWRAEKRRWGGDQGEAELLAYMEQLEEIEKWGDRFSVVARGNISPVEIVTAVRILRKRWPGQPVAFFVDHMHRLDYGSETADDKAGEATRMFRNLAMEDGNLIPVLLYQPRKPGQGGNRYSPIAGHEIRGHSEIWNELSIHLSPHRAFVETYVDQTNAWGTRKTKVDPEGRPKVARPTKDDRLDRKLDDEHAYIKIDKRRVGGEGPTCVLGFKGPSGQVYEKMSPDNPHAAPALPHMDQDPPSA